MGLQNIALDSAENPGIDPVEDLAEVGKPSVLEGTNIEWPPFLRTGPMSVSSQHVFFYFPLSTMAYRQQYCDARSILSPLRDKVSCFLDP